MKLDEICCSLELAKRLKELGVKQESFFVWEYYNDQCYGLKFIPYAVLPGNRSNIQLFSAFTASELLEMLPAYIQIKGAEPFDNFYLQIIKRPTKHIQYIVNYICDSFCPQKEISPR